MNNWFANISVSLKLGLGFGLVLALGCRSHCPDRTPGH